MLLPLVTMLLWGSLYPMIKIGYSAFAIDAASVPDILLFAALRFTLCGVLLCGVSAARRERIARPTAKTVLRIVCMGIIAITLHYACIYIGLAYTDSSKAALLKQVGLLLYICFSWLFTKEELFRIGKLVGGLVGFVGVIVMNAGDGGISFTVGDTLVLAASVCTVISSVMTRWVSGDASPFWITGISQLSGGLVLLAAGLSLGGRLPHITASAAPVFLYICAASIGGYLLWTWLVRTESISRLFLFRFAEPLFACVFGAMLLGEDIFRLQILAAFVLIALGIVIGQGRSDVQQKAERKESCEEPGKRTVIDGTGHNDV